MNSAVLGPSTVACDTERRKISKYSNLLSTCTFIPIAVETIRAVGADAMSFFTELRRRVRFIANEKRSYSFLLQRLSVAVQHGNAACVVGSVPHTARWDELFYV